MSKKKMLTQFICSDCGHQVLKWLGKCSECGAWNSFQEESFSKDRATTKLRQDERRGKSKNITEIESADTKRIYSGVGEFDRVMGGGIVPGSLILIGGEPGIGKSTLLTNIIGLFAARFPSEKVLYCSGEESESQVADRARRLGHQVQNLHIYNEVSWQKIEQEIRRLKPKFLVLDSIQTTTSENLDSAPGTVSQIREVTYELMNHTKALGLTTFVIGHITKEGSIAGPKILEHMVDTVIYFEGDQNGHYRLLRAMKNRFGNTNEVGIFEMNERGLSEVKNVGQYFLDTNIGEAYGRSLTCVIEGSRTLLIEIQALVVENNFGTGRRTTQGLDTNRLAMIVTVIEKYFGIMLSHNDIYLNVVGGMKLTHRESDLAVMASLLSSFRMSSIPESTVFMGEIGLTGEVRSPSRPELRLKELEQMGYKRVVTSKKIEREYGQKFSFEILGLGRAKELELYL